MADVGRFMVAMGAIVESAKTGRILLLRRPGDADFSAGEWEHITGRMRQFELPEDALRREVREETGLEVEVVCPLGVFHVFRGPEETADHEVVGVVYWCRADEDRVVTSAEHADHRWVTPAEALKLVGNDGIRGDIRTFEQVREIYGRAAGGELAPDPALPG